MKVLLAGFEPFGGETMNPAWEAIQRLPKEILGAQLFKIQIPVSGQRALEKIYQMMKEEHPEIVIAIGQAGGRYGVTPERVALNIDDYGIPDNEGNQPVDATIFADGAPAYFSNLPVKDMVQAIRDAGYPASLSNSAGTYVCNHVMFGILYYLEKEFPDTGGGFIHVPYAACQVVQKSNTPSMSLLDIASAIEAAVRAAILQKKKSL